MAHYVEWKPFYSVKHPLLDADHKKMLALIDDLYTAIQSGKPQTQVREALNCVVQYTMTHFDHEERVMQECGYPDFEAHKATHDQMRQRILAMQAHADLVTDKDLLRFLKEWWVRHIQNQDKTYVPFLDAMVREPAAMA